MTRDSSHLRVPGRALDGFPTAIVSPDDALFRCHRAGRGPWWFSSSGHGRFDLHRPRGTCYLGISAAVAVREAIGPEIAEFGYITADFVADWWMSKVRVPHQHRVADTTDPRAANFGVTRELCTMTPYDIPQRWAAAFDENCDGIRYEARFSTDPAATALAIFGDEGGREWPVPGPRDVTSLGVAAEEAGITVRRPPRSVRIVPPQ